MWSPRARSIVADDGRSAEHRGLRAVSAWQFLMAYFRNRLVVLSREVASFRNLRLLLETANGFQNGQRTVHFARICGAVAFNPIVNVRRWQNHANPTWAQITREPFRAPQRISCAMISLLDCLEDKSLVVC